MRKFLLAALAGACVSALAATAATRTLTASAARSDQEEALRRVQADNVAIRLELDALRRELMRRPVPPAKGPVKPDPELIPAQKLPIPKH